MINDMSPGADELANAYGKMFSVTSIKIPASQKKSTPGAMRLRCNAAPDITPERSQARVNAERGAYIPAWRDTLIPNKEAYYMDVTTDAITYLKLEATRLTEQYLLMQTVAEQAQENLQIALERLKAAEDDNRTLRAKLQQYEEPSAP